MKRIARFAAAVLVFSSALIGVGQQRTHPHPTKPVDTANIAPNPRAELVRENNFGVALMNRQDFEKALGKFQRACILDPQTDIGCLNMGIALLNMQRFDDSRKVLAKSASARRTIRVRGSTWGC